ncbi:uncharacterized protein CANTADRAFT_54477 [Suhomyces tanzawaensis NRRL Y-17324]|uniref:PHD-type domain-containing protein n=1 Tax=Suhomyces tanzawaensis NRRL Y-17324 TaxID=984487 RepID=A0A1E4SEF2_9ASCO|nr:uncharacterized protein CANTADRAFT_54477 [Suhomyces tanzawaensis NRRL Y-17324]ODV77868.1 hypothetical protein CANTADRAFT_54477 [Suhomyces tanzawaensis NRRL Y-17324]
MSKKEEEQLLQDASTLLMFANVAAKQQQQHQSPEQGVAPKKASPPPHPQPQPQPHSQAMRSPANASMSSILNLPAVDPVHTTPFSGRPPTVHGPGPLPVPASQPHSLPSMSQYSSPQYIRNPTQLKSPPIIHSQANIESRKPSLPSSTKSSISILMNSPEPLGPTNTPSPPKANVQLAHQKSVSPPSTNFPVQGSFGHKRSKSTPESADKRSSIRMHHSPGPANVALARGINLETGERNNNNAVIAAAALAAAADIPLPLKYKEHTGVKLESPATIQPPAAAASMTPKNTAPAIKKNEEESKQQSKQQSPVITSSSLEVSRSEIAEEVISSTAPTDTIAKSPVNEPATKLKPPPLESYKVDPDSGLIGCICGIEDDDGFTIQCDICYRWQHCLCMGYKTSDEVPEDEYKCYYCDEGKWGKFDPEVCREDTLNRLEIDRTTLEDKDDEQELSQRSEEYNHQQQIHQEHRKKHGQEVAHQQEVLSGKRKLLGSERADKRRRVEKELGSDSLATHNSDLLTAKSAGSVTVPVLIKKTPPKEILPNKDNQLLEEGFTSESYQSVYFNLQTNDYKRPSVKAQMLELGEDFYKGYLDLPKADQSKKEYLDTEIMSLSKFKSLKFSKKILPNHQKYYQENKINIIKKNKFNKTKIQVKPYSDNQKQKFNGISKLSLFISSSTDTVIPEGTPVIEYLGEIDFFSNYIEDAASQYRGWGTTKPKVLKTSIPKIDLDERLVGVVLDSRFVGNEARFIRKSCPSTSNCKIKRVYIPETNSFRFLVVTSEEITLKSEQADEELRLHWEWDSFHPILKLYDNRNEKFEQLSNIDKSTLISCIDNLLHFTECGCSTSSSYSSCAIFKVKKATSYLLRSTRKASSISNLNLTKSKEELILPKKEKEYISWNQRLIERDNHIQMDLSVTTDSLGQGAIDESARSDEEKGFEVEKLKDKSNLLFQVPNKQQLFLRNKEYVRNFERSKNSNEAELVENQTLCGSLPIPIIPDMIVKIEQSIDNQLKPIVKEVETKLLADIKANDVNIVKQESVPEKTGHSNPEVEVQAPAPKIIKKLSFADYKKKMK